MTRRAPQQRRLSPCNAIGCAEVIPQDSVFCERHDRMLQSDIRTIISRQYRPHGRQSKVFQITLERAQHEILYAQQNGHRIPRPAEFEWDDTPAPMETHD